MIGDTEALYKVMPKTEFNVNAMLYDDRILVGCRFNDVRKVIAGMEKVGYTHRWTHSDWDDSGPRGMVGNESYVLQFRWGENERK